MKYTIVGDIHGKVECVEEALSRDGQIIFVGDFQDSFGRAPDQHSKCYELVIDAIRAKKARAIFGNHELSYLPLGDRFPHHRCSGYDYHRQIVMDAWKPQILELFEPYILLDRDILVSHAGLTKQMWDLYNLTLGTLPKQLAEWWPDTTSAMHAIGRYRGGFHPYGGMFWCDFNKEFIPIPELTQVFGHTAGKGIRQLENSFCIDCLDHEMKFLEMGIDDSPSN